MTYGRGDVRVAAPTGQSVQLAAMQLFTFDDLPRGGQPRQATLQIPLDDVS